MGKGSSVWTVKPLTTQYDLVFVPEGGDPKPFWVKLARRLNVGEKRALQTAGWSGMRQGGDGTEINVDWTRMTFARVETYLKDWSLQDDDGNKLPLTAETIRTLDEGVYELIEGAVSQHVAALEEEKKIPSGSAEPGPTSS